MVHKFSIGLSLVALLISTLFIARPNSPTNNIQRYLWQLSVEEPDSMVKVIVRQTQVDTEAQRLIESMGGVVHQSYDFIKGFSATIPARMVPALSRLQSVQWVSLDGPVHSSSTESENALDIRDDFTAVSFNNSDAAPLWLDSWQEIGESDGPASGDLMIVDFWGGALSGARFQGASRGIQRAVSLADASSAHLDLSYRRKDFADETDQLLLQVSTDGGTQWTTLDQLSGPASDAAIQFANYDLSAWVGKPLAIRMLTSDAFNGDARFYLDSITVQMTPLAGSTPVTQVYLPVIASGENSESTIQAAATINTSALTNPYIKEIGADRLWNGTPNRQGTGVTVAVVDSGIAPNSDLNSGTSTRILATVQFGAVSGTPDDQFGHGTHVAGIIAGNGTKSAGQFIGVAPASKLVDVKVTNDFGNGSTADVVAGLQWVYNNRILYNIRIVNLSLNSTIPESYHESALDAALEVLWFNGVTVVVSAGNDGGSKLNAPANDPFVITVGAIDDRGTDLTADDLLPVFSAYAVTSDGVVKPDIVAPGNKIVSLLASDDSTLKKLFPTKIINAANGAKMMAMTGTSMASAVVAGSIALLLEDEPLLTPDQVKYRLKSTARAIGGTGSCATGAGALDAYAAVTGTSTQSANTGLVASSLLWSGSSPVAWNSVNWNSVNWNSVNWNSVNWNSVNWNAVNWNSVNWNSMRWDEVTGGLLSSVSGCNGGGNGLAVTYFTLIDANSDREIMALSDQMVIDLATLPSNSLTILANTRANAASVYLELDNGTYSRSENSAPFSLYGDGAGPNYQGAAFSLGTHKIRAIPYPSTGLGGTAGTALTVEFTVVDSRNNNRNFASTLVAQQSNKCMDVPASTTAPATQLQQWSCNATNAQNYQFEPVGTLKNTYRIKNRGNGLCLDIYGSDTADGAALIQYGCTGSRNQQFVLRPVENKAGTFQIVAAHSGKCIDVTGASTSDGAKLIQWSCSASLNQQWAMNGFVKSNTLLNSSFESQYSAWGKYAGSEQLSSDAADGGAALLLASAGSGVNQVVSVLPGRPYVLGVSMKGTDSNNGSSLLATYYDQDWNILQMNYIPATVSSTYVRSKLYTVAPSNAAQLHLAFWKPNAGGNWFIDQVAVEQTGSTANQCSIDGGSSISNVRFTNNRSSSVVIQWVNQSCGEVTYKTLAPGQTWVTSTTVNHVWRVKDSATGNLLLEVTASASSQQNMIN